MKKTHNKIFIENLLNGLYNNIDYYLEKAFKSNDTYIAFMNALANVIYKKLNMKEITLPIQDLKVDFQVSTRCVIAITDFDSSFVNNVYDAYYFAVTIDDYKNLRVFDFELDYDKNNKPIYLICEYFIDGSSKVLQTANFLYKDQFGGALYDILKK